jgi:excinuclease UvrABC nuclease subunit
VLRLSGDKHKTKLLVNELQILREPGVYILYRDDLPYCVGKARTLFQRLHDHANKATDRYFQLWNRFSAFVTKDQGHEAPPKEYSSKLCRRRTAPSLG